MSFSATEWLPPSSLEHFLTQGGLTPIPTGSLGSDASCPICLESLPGAKHEEAPAQLTIQGQEDGSSETMSEVQDLAQTLDYDYSAAIAVLGCDEVPGTVMTPCGHLFCRECIVSWLEGPGTTCPYCRCQFYVKGRPRRAAVVELDRARVAASRRHIETAGRRLVESAMLDDSPTARSTPEPSSIVLTELAAANRFAHGHWAQFAPSERREYGRIEQRIAADGIALGTAEYLVPDDSLRQQLSTIRQRPDHDARSPEEERLEDEETISPGDEDRAIDLRTQTQGRR